MEKELNIAAILEDKPDVILYDLIHNRNVKFDKVCVSDNDTVIWCDNYLRNPKESICAFCYSERGTIKGYLDGLQILKPSKEMQDWSKFAWKKGDVLTDEERFVIFKGFNTDDYTDFSAPFEYKDDAYRQGLWLVTNDFRKVSDNIAQAVIKKVEEHYGGKLNLSTLEIEQPKQEFKDGDIVEFGESVAICEKFEEDKLYFYACIDAACGLFLSDSVETSSEYRLATESEKQQLIDALAKKNKAWDAEKKMLVDLPKKCEFEPMDWCLMRDLGDRRWGLCQFGFYISKEESEEGVDYYPYCAVGGNWYHECIPYNDQTAHLLGTTDEWKGGEG